MGGRRRFLTGALALVPAFALAGRVHAQGKPPLDEAAITRDIMAMRDALRAAVVKKDRAAVAAFYADNFQHLRDTGRADGKGERVTLLIAGEKTIELVDEAEVAVSAYGPGVAVAIGTSPIPDPASKRPALFRWMSLYVKDEAGWRIAMSQATRLRGNR